MPRLNNGQEIFRKLDKLEVFRAVATTPGDQTITSAVAVGASTVPVAAITNFTANDPVFLIGSGGLELNRIGTPATTMPLLRKTGLAHLTGARLLEAIATDFGHIDESGVVMSPSAALTAIPSALSALPVQYISGVGEIGFNFNLLGFNLLNLCTIFGIPEAEQGAGTSGDPWQVFVSGAAMGTQGTQVIRATGTRHDGLNIEVDFLDVRVEVQGSVTLNRNAPAVLPFAGKCTALAMRIFS